MFSYGWPSLVFITHLCNGIRVTVNRRNESLSTVPQDVATDVTHFILEDNDITHIDFNSFKNYTELWNIDLSRNPLKNIANGTFENNHKLSQIICIECAIESAPASFGPCTAKITKIDFHQGVVNSHVLLNFEFKKFTRLSSLKLTEVALPDLNVLQLPPSIRALSIFDTGLSTLPQVGRTRFPKLTWIYLVRNDLNLEIPYSWFNNISIDIQALSLAADGVVSVPEILPIKPSLSFFAIEKNRLVTIPDMLDFSALKYLFIRDNPVTCDQKMCWRRLWDRKRAPLLGDDVRCQMPLRLQGAMLATVNPKLLSCYNGKWSSDG